jgi:hypothetical protein
VNALISSPVMSAAIAVPTTATKPAAASAALTVVRMRFTPAVGTWQFAGENYHDNVKSG